MTPLKIKNKNHKTIYRAMINQVLNGYIVTIFEDEPIMDSETIPEIEEQMEMIVQSLNNSLNSDGDDEIKKIIRKNEKKDSEKRMKKVGSRIFYKFSEAAAFMSFIFDDSKLEDNINN